jgi:hypothetical protein
MFLFEDDFPSNLAIQSELESKKISQTNENVYLKQKRSTKIDSGKNEIFIEYINFINNPFYKPKYLSSTTKLNSLGKKCCSRLFRSSNPNRQLTKSGLFDDFEERRVRKLTCFKC